MTVTKDVILDLLPLYEAGEVSADTRALVEAYLREHPDVKPAVSADAFLKGAAPVRPEQERRLALEYTRSLLAKRQRQFGVALAGTLLPFAFSFNSSGIAWFMLRDAPLPAGISLSVAIACWFGYFNSNRKLRVTGM